MATAVREEVKSSEYLRSLHGLSLRQWQRYKADCGLAGKEYLCNWEYFLLSVRINARRIEPLAGIEPQDLIDKEHRPAIYYHNLAVFWQTHRSQYSTPGYELCARWGISESTLRRWCIAANIEYSSRRMFSTEEVSILEFNR
jgi:hypothetical protein